MIVNLLWLIFAIIGTFFVLRLAYRTFLRPFMRARRKQNARYNRMLSELLDQDRPNPKG